MQIGLLGKANVGKSTFFSAATEAAVQIGNFPFTTIEPNVGVAHVKRPCACAHFAVSHESDSCSGGVRLIPVKLIDVAGLVPGAHEGKGLGNKFLDDARQADALIHVIDVAGATDLQGQPVNPGSHDPLKDIEFVHAEFDMWFFQILEREWPRLTKEIEQKTAKLLDGITKRFSGLGVGEADVRAVLQENNLLAKKPGEWDAADMKALACGLRRRTRPILIAANKADLCGDLGILERIKETAIACSAEAELLLRRAAKSGLIKYSPGSDNFEVVKGADISAQQKKALDAVRGILAKIGGTGVQEALDCAVFGALEMITAYPVEDESKLCNKDGQVLPDAILLKKGASALDLARAVHEDIAKGFLYAIDCKKKQRIGAEHELADGDVIKVVSSAGRR